MDDLILENSRVLLRPLTENDWDLLLPFSLHEPEIWDLSPKGANGEENLRHYIKDAFIQKENGTGCPFIVIDKLRNQCAGMTRFYNINTYNRHAEIGYTWYGKAFRGSGINKQCKFLLLEHAFEKMNLLRVGFRGDLTNTVSIAAMKSIGATEEGILRQEQRLPNGRFRDTIVLSILQNEWLDTIKKDLAQKLS